MLTDFGLARRSEIDQSEQTRPGEWLGTPAYMAPEQFSGNSDDVSPSCDLFRWAVVLYRLLTGQRPFGDGHRAQEIVSRKTPESPTKLRAVVTNELSEICLRAMRFDPKERFDNAGDFAAALEPFTYDSVVIEAGSTTAFGTTQRNVKSVSRDQRRAVVVALLACAIVVVAAPVGWKSMYDGKDSVTKSNSSTSVAAKTTSYWLCGSRNIP